MKNLFLLSLLAVVLCITLSEAVEFQQYEDDSPEGRIHKKNKIKKLKKRLLLNCLLQSGRRRRRDTAPTGRFLLPIVLQSTNVNVNDGGYTGSDSGHDYQGGGGSSVDHDCMHLINNHGPLLSGAVSSAGSIAGIGDSGSRHSYGMHTNWDRYARQFHRNFVRPLYRLF
ncbi:uncharacterized protein LOC126901672 [Daktulosphaira vitifoliae]|uniref:uncharacterized protein LOC126901672 n=1 Tax=Daktulosphaira vitifoliae TaxID=58002 RepID=UPI0021AAA6F9|nr:uncharacterized protein LOC126901672 [Daktulosphaira vitifoliae]